MGKSIVVVQLKYAAVKEREEVIGVSKAFSVSERKKHGEVIKVYDVWTWNVWSMKWTRMSQQGSGFWSRADAKYAAIGENDKIDLMLSRNAQPWKPDPL